MRLQDVPGWRQPALFTLAALAMRAMVFGDPVVHVDEEFYFATAGAMLHGALPYVDIWDRKPIGLFLLYLPAAALGLPWGTYAYQFAALASLVATAGMVARFARRAGWGAGAIPAGLAYVVWPDLLNGVGGQSPIFYNLPMAMAAWLVATGGRTPRRRSCGIGAMALVGVALQIKYSAVFEGMFFGSWLAWQEWRARRSVVPVVGYASALVAAALAPTVLALAGYAAAGHADAFVYANFISVLHRNPDPPGEELRNIGTLVLILSPLVAMAAGSRRTAAATDARVRDVRLFLGWWLAVAIAAVAAFPGWFDHYGLPVLVPAASCAAGLFTRGGRARRIGIAVVAIAAGCGLVTVAVNRRNRGDAAQFARLAQAVGRGPGCLYVYSGSTMLFPATGRCSLSRYVVPSHLNRWRERGATGTDQPGEVRRILALRPAVIVMRPPFRGERADVRALVLTAVAGSYRLAATVPMGRERVAVYKR